MAAGGEFDAQFRRNDSAATICGIACDADLHKAPALSAKLKDFIVGVRRELSIFATRTEGTEVTVMDEFGRIRLREDFRNSL